MNRFRLGHDDQVVLDLVIFNLFQLVLSIWKLIEARGLKKNGKMKFIIIIIKYTILIIPF